MRNPDTFKVAAEVASEEAQTAGCLLVEMGALGAQEEDDPASGMTRVTAYFDSARHDRKALRDEVASAFLGFPRLRGAWIEVELEPARDWNERWREFFKPFVLAEGFVVVPSWERYEARPGEAVIHIDPGMAFGTGLHETTRMCARAMIDSVRARGEPPRSLLDVGTGSGILAIIAARLGIARIAGVDDDPDALAIARENLSKNGLNGVELMDDVEKARGPFDIVVANILLATLAELRPAIEGLVAPSGTLILSGITRDQEDEAIGLYSRCLVHLRTERAGEWSAIVMWRAV